MPFDDAYPHDRVNSEALASALQRLALTRGGRLEGATDYLLSTVHADTHGHPAMPRSDGAMFRELRALRRQPPPGLSVEILRKIADRTWWAIEATVPARRRWMP
jgi:hypothetical protein